MRISAAPLLAIALVLGAIPLAAQTKTASTNAPNGDDVELLRRTLAAQQANPDKVIRTPAPAPLLITRAELERLYLEGKMTARQHQKALEQLTKDEQARAAEIEKLRLLEALHRQQQAEKTAAAAIKPPASRTAAPRETTGPAIKPAPAAAAVQSPASEPTAEQKKISEVESRIDEMLRQKAERDKTALTNAAPKAAAATTAAPLTKRQRMDALLKQLVEGKISDAEYHEKRNKLLGEPD